MKFKVEWVNKYVISINRINMFIFHGELWVGQQVKNKTTYFDLGVGTGKFK